MSRFIPIVVGLVVLAGIGFWWRSRPAPAPPAPPPVVVRPVRTMTLGPVAGATARSLPGRVQAARGRRVDVAFRVPGTVAELPVRTDQTVRQGQLLARLDVRDFETRVTQASSAVAEAQARLAAMQAGDRPEDIRILESQLAVEQARLTEAEQDFTRTQNLFDRGAATLGALDQATRARDVARASTAAAGDALKRARAGARPEDLEAQRALIRRLEAQQREARDALADTRLTAPFAGVVARTMVDTFQEVQAREPILSLRDAAGLEIVTDVPESIMVQLNTVNVRSVVAEFDFLPGRTFPVTLSESEIEADSRTRTFAVVFSMPTVPREIRVLPGMTATIRVEMKTPTAADEWPIPSSAVFVDAGGKRHVWRVNKETQAVSRVAVEVGEVRGDQVVLRGGLGAGDTIVTAGVNSLQEGDKIQALPAEGAQIR
jgi:RND family efflux transporter MFP subunit